MNVVAGNYYSLRSQHEKAVLYFQRALKLNPGYLSAWTLMGHEYMELKQTSAAIRAYRQAIGQFSVRFHLLSFMSTFKCTIDIWISVRHCLYVRELNCFISSVQCWAS